MTAIPEIPFGAIENGRVLLQRLADHYNFNCEAGALANCTDYHEAVRCFEFIAQWVSALTALEPSAARELAFCRDYGEPDVPDSEYRLACNDIIEATQERRALSSPDHADAGKVEGDGWLPIETAPKDGSEFLAWPCNTGNGVIVVKAHWYVHPSVEAWITNEIDCGDYDFTPTHWRPLPASPGASE